MEANDQKLFMPGRRLQKTFVSDGFNSWKKCPKALKEHETSEQHREGINNLKMKKQCGSGVISMVNENFQKDQKQHQAALVAMFETAKFLLEQGLPFQGHDDESGNFVRLLHLRAQDIPALSSWLNRRNKWCSHSIQNEIIELIANAVRENIRTEIQASGVFSIIADGTQDISGYEQLSIVFRHVSQTFEVSEDFVGFYNLSEETGLAISKAIEDVVIRLQMEMKFNRGLGFDGASNMRGPIKGARALLSEKYPLSLYFHCANHCLDLCLQEVAKEEDIIFKILEFAKMSSDFVRHSGKRRALFKAITTDLECAEEEMYSNVQPLCPTRWVVRVRCLTSIRKNWKPLKLLLENISGDGNTRKEVRAKAAGILKKLNLFETLLGCSIAIQLFLPCEKLARQLQAKTTTPCSALSGSHLLLDHLQNLRTEAAFNELYEEVSLKATELEIPKPIQPRKRKNILRFESSSEPQDPHIFETFKDRVRQEYFAVIDRLLTSIKDRFEQPGIMFAAELEKIVVSAANGKIEALDRISPYPEICSSPRTVC
jgi:hypothetical protein